jgi:hypothetical protein
MDTLAASLGLDSLGAKCKQVNEGADSCLQDCHAKQGQFLLPSCLFSCKVLRAIEVYLAYAARTPFCACQLLCQVTFAMHVYACFQNLKCYCCCCCCGVSLQWYKQGARFAKWRAVLRIAGAAPSAVKDVAASQ